MIENRTCRLAPRKIKKPGGVNFRRRYPGIRLELHVGNTQHVVERLVGRQDDVAVIAASVQHPDLVVEPVGVDPLVVVVPRDHEWRGHKAVTLHQLEGQPLIVREPGSSTRQALEAEFLRSRLRPQIAMELGSHEAIIGAVEHGLGVGVLPLSMAQRDIERRVVRAVRLRGVRLRHTVSVVYHAERAAFPLIQRFVEIARALRGERRSAG